MLGRVALSSNAETKEASDIINLSAWVCKPKPKNEEELSKQVPEHQDELSKFRAEQRWEKFETYHKCKCLLKQDKLL